MLCEKKSEPKQQFFLKQMAPDKKAAVRKKGTPESAKSSSIEHRFKRKFYLENCRLSKSAAAAAAAANR